MNNKSETFLEINRKDEEFIKEFKKGNAYKKFKEYYDQPHKDEFVRFIKFNNIEIDKITATVSLPKKVEGMDAIEVTLGYKTESHEMKKLIVALPPMFASRINFERKKISFKLNRLDDDYKSLIGECKPSVSTDIDPDCFFGQFYENIQYLLAEKKIKLGGKQLTEEDLRVRLEKGSGIPLWWDKNFKGEGRTRVLESAEAILTCRIQVDEEVTTKEGKQYVFNTEFIDLSNIKGENGIIKDGKKAIEVLSNRSLLSIVYLDMSRIFISSSKTLSIARIDKIRYMPVQMPSRNSQYSPEEGLMLDEGDYVGVDKVNDDFEKKNEEYSKLF